MPGLRPFSPSPSESVFFGLLAGLPLHQAWYGFNLLVKMLLASPRFLMFPLLRNLICDLYRSRFGWGFLGERSGISDCFSGTLVQFTLYTKEIVPFRLG